MRDRKVALRYAQALLAVAVERGEVEGLEESLRGVVEVVEGHPDLRLVLRSPQVPQARKKELLGTLFGRRVEAVLLQFLELLLDKGRFGHLAGIQESFTDLVEEHRGLQRARVVTAVPLADDLQEKLTARLAALTGRRIVLEKKVDPSVIGGVCVTMGDRILDGTLRTGLQRLREALESAPLRMS